MGATKLIIIRLYRGFTTLQNNNILPMSTSALRQIYARKQRNHHATNKHRITNT